MYLIGFTVDNHILKKSNQQQKIGGLLLDIGYEIVAHSDGDIIIHAIAESLLGAMGKGDLGDHFSDTDSQNHNLDSTIILKKILVILNEEGYSINNIDVTVVCDDILFASYKPQIKSSLCKYIPNTQINLKYTRFEKKQTKYISCYATCIITKEFKFPL